MERNYLSTTSIFVHPDELDLRTAYHEAGHAAAIHLGNRQKLLPPVFFEILVKKPSANNGLFFAKVIDGNLIQNLPIAVIESHALLSGHEQHCSQRAFEADVINLLVGPLSEAKYVATRDNEIFNLNIINFASLHNYGGFSDLRMIEDYLHTFIATKPQREKAIRKLLAQAFEFIDDPLNWHCIQQLAGYILESGQEVISCDEAICLLDNSLTTFPWFFSDKHW